MKTLKKIIGISILVLLGLAVISLLIALMGLKDFLIIFGTITIFISLVFLGCYLAFE